MALERLPIESIEAYVADLDFCAAELKRVVSSMKASGLTEIWAHYRMVESKYLPKTMEFATECVGAMADARSAKASGRDPTAVREKEKAAKTVANRQAKKATKKKAAK